MTRLLFVLACCGGLASTRRAPWGRSPSLSPPPPAGSSAATPREAAEFASWTQAHGVQYASAAEEAADLSQWLENDRSIHAHNDAAVGFELGHNVYSSHSWDQFERKMGIGLSERRMQRDEGAIGVHRAGDYRGDSPELEKTRHRRSVAAAVSPMGMLGEAPDMDGQEWESVLNPSSTQLGNTNSKVPASRDWVAEGAVSEVYNQANCGACWSFAAAGAIEGLFFTQTGELLPLSQQHLLACDYGPKAGRYRDNGCNGGLPDSAFGWVARNGGICSYADVPYISGNGRMYSCQRCTPVVMVSGFVDVTPRDELALMDAVAQQPVAVGIDASEYAFMFYKSGVLDTPKCGDVLDHAVLIVGYGTDAATGKPYWKVKNSWGPTWGEGGYVRMVRGKNMCGIADMPSYPIANMPMRALHRLSAAAVSDGITCNEPMDGDAKLTSYPAGSLLVFESGQWRTVCADTMGKSTAQLACYLLGYKAAAMFTNRVAAGGPYNITGGLQCKGSEFSFNQCAKTPIQRRDWCADYPTDMAAYVKCYGLPDDATPIAAGALKCGTAGWGGVSVGAQLRALGPQRAQLFTSTDGASLGVSLDSPPKLATRPATYAFCAAAALLLVALAFAFVTVPQPRWMSAATSGGLPIIAAAAASALQRRPPALAGIMSIDAGEGRVGML